MDLSSGQAQLARGALGAAFLVLAASLALLPIIHLAGSEPSAELLRALAQIGATLLVAYAVELAWLLNVAGGPNAAGEDRERRAGWVGYAAGVGLCGLLGIALALVYAENDTSALGVIPEFGLGWVFVSLALLGLLVALLPPLVYGSAQIAPESDRDEPAGPREGAGEGRGGPPRQGDG